MEREAVIRGMPCTASSRISIDTKQAMFDTLEADIVVFQETKIQRKDLRDDMVLVPGWDCYFSLPRVKKGMHNCLQLEPNILIFLQATPELSSTLAMPNVPPSAQKKALLGSSVYPTHQLHSGNSLKSNRSGVIQPWSSHLSSKSNQQFSTQKAAASFSSFQHSF